VRRGEYEDERWQAARHKAQDSFLARADNSWALLKPELFTVSVSRPKFDLGICRLLWGWGISPWKPLFNVQRSTKVRFRIVGRAFLSRDQGTIF